MTLIPDMSHSDSLCGKTRPTAGSMSGQPGRPPIDPALAGRRRLTLIATIVGSSMTFVDGPS